MVMYFMVFCLLVVSANGNREKRFLLVWQEGRRNWVEIVLGYGIPAQVNDQSITVGSVMKAFYRLPTNSSIYTRPNIDYVRKKRATSRWDLYSAIETIFESFGYGDGKSCLLRLICEASSTPFDTRTGIMAEISHALLTPSTTNDIIDDNGAKLYHSAERLGRETDRCSSLFGECDVNLIEMYSKLLV